MVEGENFVWAHFGKTGGNSVHRMFQIINDGSLIIDDVADPGKHRGFPKAKNHKIRILNIRRLPSWLTSHNLHMARYYDFGEFEKLTTLGLTWHPKYDIQPADFYLDLFEYHSVKYWFRTDSLSEDFISIMSQFIPFDAVAKSEIYSVYENRNTVNKIMTPWSSEIEQRMYKANPKWEKLEKALFHTQ